MATARSSRMPLRTRASSSARIGTADPKTKAAAASGTHASRSTNQNNLLGKSLYHITRNAMKFTYVMPSTKASNRPPTSPVTSAA